MQLYPYQQTVKNKAISLFQTGDYVYVQMPTGTGKTITAIETLKELGGKSVLWAVGSLEIANQTKEVAPPFIEVITWQRTIRNQLNYSHYDFLVIDEVHFGGSNKHPSEVFSKLLTNFEGKRKLYVSASPWELDFGVLGEINDRESSYYIEDAFRDGNIPNLNIHQLRTGKTLEVNAVESGCGTTIEHLASLEDSSLTTFLSKVKLDRACFESIRGILKARMDALINDYADNFTSFIDSSALFFAPNTSMVAYTVSELKKRGINCLSVSYFESDCGAKINRFKNEPNLVMVACNMLTFGFDMPRLRLVFDGSFSGENTRRNYQKMGRLLRGHPNKSSVLYTYVRDIGNITNDDCSTSSDMMKIMYCDRHILPICADDRLIDASHGDDRSSFAEITNAHGSECHGFDRFSSIVNIHYRHYPDEKKKQLILMARRGDKRPSCRGKSDLERKLSSGLHEYTTKCRGDYDCIFDAEIRQIAPKWFKDPVHAKREAILEMARAGGSLKKYKLSGYGGFSYSQLKSCLDAHTRPENLSWGGNFLKELMQIDPTIFNSKQRLKGVMAHFLKNDPVFHAKISRRRLNWLTKGRTK